MIGIVAPSGPLRGVELEEIREAIESHGYKVKFSTGCKLSYRGYLAGHDMNRCRDLESMFLDDEIDIIMCLRGGYGSMRILDMIDYNIIKNNQKPFIGFSDITALHIAFNQKCGLKTFHGLMGTSSPRWDDFSYNSLIDALKFEDEIILKNPKGHKIKTVYLGKAEGEIIGGNLALISSTMGTEYEIDARDKILFLEDVGESLYKLDRMLTQLKLAKKFDECKGVIFGSFKNCADDEDLYELFYDILKDSKKPSVFNFRSGHCMPMITVPLGEHCILNASKKEIKVVR